MNASEGASVQVFDAYCPEDRLSVELIKSIPVKVVNWLKNLQIDIDSEFKTGRLTVLVTPEGGWIKFGEEIDEDFILIAWDEEYSNVRTTNLALVEAAVNLGDFVHVETSIYDELEAFQKEELSRTTPRMPSFYDREEDEQLRDF